MSKSVYVRAVHDLELLRYVRCAIEHISVILNHEPHAHMNKKANNMAKSGDICFTKVCLLYEV